MLTRARRSILERQQQEINSLPNDRKSIGCPKSLSRNGSENDGDATLPTSSTETDSEKPQHDVPGEVNQSQSSGSNSNDANNAAVTLITKKMSKATRKRKSSSDTAAVEMQTAVEDHKLENYVESNEKLKDDLISTPVQVCPPNVSTSLSPTDIDTYTSASITKKQKGSSTNQMNANEFQAVDIISSAAMECEVIQKSTIVDQQTSNVEESCQISDNNKTDGTDEADCDDRKVLRSGRIVRSNQPIKKVTRRSRNKSMENSEGLLESIAQVISHVNQDQILGTEPKNESSSPPSKGIMYANANDQKSTANDDESERQCIHSVSTIPSGSNTSTCMLLEEMENTIDEALPPPSTEEEQDDESMETEDLEFIIIKSDPRTAKNGNAKSFGDAKGVSSSTVNENLTNDSLVDSTGANSNVPSTILNEPTSHVGKLETSSQTVKELTISNDPPILAGSEVEAKTSEVSGEIRVLTDPGIETKVKKRSIGTKEKEKEQCPKRRSNRLSLSLKSTEQKDKGIHSDSDQKARGTLESIVNATSGAEISIEAKPKKPKSTPNDRTQTKIVEPKEKQKSKDGQVRDKNDKNVSAANVSWENIAVNVKEAFVTSTLRKDGDQYASKPIENLSGKTSELAEKTTSSNQQHQSKTHKDISVRKVETGAETGSKSERRLSPTPNEVVRVRTKTRDAKMTLKEASINVVSSVKQEKETSLPQKIIKEEEVKQSDASLNQRPKEKEINISKWIDEKKKSKPKPSKPIATNSKILCAKADEVLPLVQKTEWKTENKLELLNKQQFLNTIPSQVMRQRLIDEKFELPVSVLGKGTTFSNFVEVVQRSESENAESSQLVSQQNFEEAVVDAKIDLVRVALKKGNAFDLNRNVGDGQTILHHLAALSCSTNHSYCDLIDLLVSYGARIDLQDDLRRIPLQIAIENERLCHVRKLIELHSPINFESCGGTLPLTTAIEQYQYTGSVDSLSIVKSILVAGATFHDGFKELPSNYRHTANQQQLLRLLNSHQMRLQGALDLARKTVLRQTANVRALTSLFVCPLYEFTEIRHKFPLNYDSALTGPSYCHVIFIALVDFLPHKVEARMWGPCPVLSVKLNEANCELFSPKNKFIYLCHARHSSNNLLSIKIDPSFKKSQMKIVSQLALVQLLPQRFYQNAY